MYRYTERDSSSYYNKERPHSDANSISDTDLFVSTLKELLQRTKKVLKFCEPFSLIYKELEDVLLIIETKENYFAKAHERVSNVSDRNVSLKSFFRNQNLTNDVLTNTAFDDSITMDDSVQNFRRQGRELINEYKSVLDEMKTKNRALKAICLNPGIQQQFATDVRSKRDLLSPTSVPISPLNALISPSRHETSSVNPVNQVTGTKFNSRANFVSKAQVHTKQNTSYSEVLLNIEKFMCSLDQRAQGHNKRIENITQELDVLRQQMQPYKHIREISDIAEKLEEQHELLQEKSKKEQAEGSHIALYEDSCNREPSHSKIIGRNLNAEDISEQVKHKVYQMNEIQTNFDDCSKLLVRKRLEHTYAKENGRLNKKFSEPELLRASQYQNIRESQSQEKLSDLDKNSGKNSEFVQAALSRRELRIKNYLEREERLKESNEAEKGEQIARESRLSSNDQDFSMVQTLKRSENQNRFKEAEAVEVRVNYGSRSNTAAKIDEEMVSTRKSCLTRRDANSKENSISKGDKRIRFADEESEGRALRFDELDVYKPLDNQDLNVQSLPKLRAKKTVLKGEISQLDKEIKVISQLLNSALISD